MTCSDNSESEIYIAIAI